jgi:hypothetical protein
MAQMALKPCSLLSRSVEGSTTMKRILAGALALTLLGSTAAADASSWHHGGGWGHGGGWSHGGHWGHGGWGWGPGAVALGLGAFVLGAAIVGSASHDHDRYYGDDNYGPPPPPRGYYDHGGYNGDDGYYDRGAPQGDYRGAPPNDSYRGDSAPRTAPNAPSQYDDGEY